MGSCEVLESLGHRCDIIASVDNFTWFPHKPTIKHLPAYTDAIINVAAVDVPATMNAKTDVVKAWYIRAHESWANSEDTLRRQYNTPSIINIVNANGLKNQLETYGASSEVVYQGLDLDLWYDKELRPKNKIRIGCLHTKQARKRWKDFVGLKNLLGTTDYEYVGMGNSVPQADFLTDFKCNVGPNELRELYSSCHMWFAPTESEGLHNPPMEASLCGALVVCSDHPLNGMVFDYAFKNTAMIYKFGDLNQAAEMVRSPDWKKINRLKRYIVENIGTREHNMAKLVRALII